MLKPHSKILIVLTGSLGDVVRGMCVVGQLKTRAPTCEVTWVIDDKWSKVLSLHNQIDRVIVFERKQGFKGVVKLWRELRKYTFDITLDLQRHFKSGLISYFSGAKVRVGFHKRNCKEFNYLFNNHQIEFYHDSLAKIQHYLKFVEYVGCEVSEPLRFGFEDLDPKSEIPALVSELSDSAVGIVLGSSWESKDWLPQGYYNLILQLAKDQGVQVVLLGDPSQKTLSDELMKQVPDNLNVTTMVAKTSLVELISLIKALTLCIGPDSGPGHIAAAVETPYVSLFGPTPPERVAPYANEDLVVRTKLGCMPCYKKKCPGLNRLCMRLISADQVMAVVRPVLASLR